MNCNRCNKQGAKPYKYNDNGTVASVYLCDACFSEISLSNNQAQRSQPTQQSSLLKMERKCPACGKTLASIRKTGYLGCAECFLAFRSELISVIDKFQNGIISSPEKKQREMAVMMLEDEYSALLMDSGRRPTEISATSRRLKEIEAQLAELGVRVDE